jgi:hypothetical protein
MISAPDACERVNIKDSFGSQLTISLRRTIRVPDNGQSYELPPDCGPFPIYSISQHAERLPEHLVGKCGVFVPTHPK